MEALEGVIPPSLLHPEVLPIAHGEVEVPFKDITVWIDPLDATKEFTGTESFLRSGNQNISKKYK